MTHPHPTWRPSGSWRGQPVLAPQFRSQSTKRHGKPWTQTFHLIRARCENPSNPVYDRYGGRGIRCQITKAELLLLWFRDKAYRMKRPSIDRIDNNGSYTFENCRYIELSINCCRDRARSHCPAGHALIGKNVRLHHQGRERRCVTCRNAQRRAWRHRKSALRRARIDHPTERR